MKKKLIATLLSVTLLFATSMPAYASEITTAGDGTVPVDLTVETPIFSVTVPTVLPVTLTQNGEVTVATNAMIVNNSAGPIKITGIQTKGANGWSTTDFAGFDMKSAKVGGRDVGLNFKFGSADVKTKGADINDFTGSVTLIKDESLPLTYSAKIPAQKVAKIGEQIAEVILTVAWDE